MDKKPHQLQSHKLTAVIKLYTEGFEFPVIAPFTITDTLTITNFDKNYQLEHMTESIIENDTFIYPKANKFYLKLTLNDPSFFFPFFHKDEKLCYHIDLSATNYDYLRYSKNFILSISIIDLVVD